MTTTTPTIHIERQPRPERLAALEVNTWGIWTKEVSTFPWYYDEAETCYFLEGEVTVIPEGGEPVMLGKGDLVTFAAGLACTWQITKAVKKHYSFG
ncbi:cupin domain-containing protein [Synechococcus moorigangaii CMS01]|nr:cupin domain-containing protein [Synechococcus moorigangaii CMS01]